MKRLLQNLPIRVKIGLIVLLPLCGYLVSAGMNLLTILGDYGSARSVASLVAFDGQISQLVHELQKERGSSSGFLASKGQKFADILTTQRTATDDKAAAYRRGQTEIVQLPAAAARSEQLKTFDTLASNLLGTRQKVSNQQIEPKEAIAYYTSLINALLDLTAAISHLSNDPDITAQMFAYVSFLQAKERSGIERATMSAVFSKGAFTTETFSRFLQLLAAQDSYLASFRAQSLPDARKAYDATVRGQVIEEVERMRQVAMGVGMDSSKTFGIDPEVWFKTITEKINLLKTVDDELAQQIIKAASTKAEALWNRLVQILVGFAAVLAASMVLMITTSISLMAGINTANRIALDLAEGEGDLTKRMNLAATDEIGSLGRSIDSLLTSLGGMISQIKASGETMGQSGQELAALAEQMTGAAGTIQGKANGVAAAAEEMNINMNSVAAAVEETAVNVATVAGSTGSIASAGKDIADRTRNALAMTSEAVNHSRSSYAMISTLGEAAREIGRVTETITEISEQTNLLALNATIEAARAGEAGKGFAVVANEIKELAKQTAGATVEINGKIQGIQDSTERTVAEIEKILAVIDKVNGVVDGIASAVDHQTAATDEIAGNIEQASVGLQEVAHNVSQISAVSGEVAKDIAEVSYSSQELTSSSGLVRQSAANLNDLTATLQGITGRFKV